MSNRDDPVPHDQFERVLREMRKLDQLVGEVQQHVAIARGVSKYEAQRALDHASACVEVAQYWMGKAIAEALKAKP